MKHFDLRHIGVIGPAGNMALERELPAHLPAGFAINHARADRPDATRLTTQSLLTMGRNAVAAAQTLIRTRPEIILYACTSGSFVQGPGSEDSIAEEITATTGCPALTTSRGLLQALDHLDVRSVFLVTPYPEEINAAEVAFLQASVRQVIGCKAHACCVDYPISAVDSRDTVDLILQNRDLALTADAVFISCTNLLTFDIIAELERELDRPVISSNQASLWAVLKAVGAQSQPFGQRWAL